MIQLSIGRIKMKTAKVKRLVLSTVLVTLVAIGAPLLAHHGTAAFDTSKDVTVKGTVTELIFSNPHVQIHWEVKTGKGGTEQWQGELTAPSKLTRAGWTKTSLKPGDEITASGFQVKSGNHTLWIRKLIGPDGEPMQLYEE
jgi:Family of unknown function (DUF6152)